MLHINQIHEIHQGLMKFYDLMGLEKHMEGFLRPMSILLRKFVRLSCGKFHNKSRR